MGLSFEIRDEFKKFIDRPRDEEFSILEEQILRDGVRHPLTIWKEENVLIDGHTRLSICQKHNIPYEVEALSFESADHVKAWMAKNQIGRRNLTAMQVSFLRGFQYEVAKKDLGAQKGNENASVLNVKNEVEKISTSFPNDTGITKTGEKIAVETGVTEKTVRNDAKFAKNVILVSNLFEDPNSTKNSILTGKTKISKKALAEIAVIAEGGDIDQAKKIFQEESAPKKTKKKLTNKKRKKGGVMNENTHNYLMPDEMDKAFKDLMFEIDKARDGKWESVAKEAVEHQVKKLMAAIDG